MIKWSDETVEAVCKEVALNRIAALRVLTKVAECKEVRELHALLVEAEGALSYTLLYGPDNAVDNKMHANMRGKAMDILTKLHAAGIGGK